MTMSSKVLNKLSTRMFVSESRILFRFINLKVNKNFTPLREHKLLRNFLPLRIYFHRGFLSVLHNFSVKSANLGFAHPINNFRTERFVRCSSEKKETFSEIIENRSTFINKKLKENAEILKKKLESRRSNIRDNFRKRREDIRYAICLSQRDLQELLRKRRERLREALYKRKARMNISEERLRERGRVIIQDLRDTKKLVREKIEEVVEKEDIYTIPNLLCVTRIAFSPYLGYLIVTENFEYALGFMVIAGISDWVDGWIARNYKSQSSKIGSFLDPMADKVLIGTLFITLTYVDLIPVALTSLIIARDVALVVAGFVIRYRSLPPPRTLARYFDATYATAQLAPTAISKINTGVQLLLVASTLAAPVFHYVGHPVLNGLCYITAASTVLAAASYIGRKDTYKYMRRNT